MVVKIYIVDRLYKYIDNILVRLLRFRIRKLVYFEI